MTTVVVLAMHGMPPKDFPRQEASEFFGLHARLKSAGGADRTALESRYAVLDARMRSWPRTKENDPYHANSLELARQLSVQTGCPVLVGFNEFCAPSLDEALEEAVCAGDRVIALTPMMTRGGDHSERDIPEAIGRAKARHPTARIDYLWPFRVEEIARFLALQLEPLLIQTYASTA